eukprot:756141-Hanusia_phi.AAC.7
MSESLPQHELQNDNEDLQEYPDCTELDDLEQEEPVAKKLRVSESSREDLEDSNEIKEDEEECASASGSEDSIDLEGCQSLSDLKALCMQKFQTSQQLLDYIHRKGGGHLMQMIPFLMSRPRLKLPGINTLDDVCRLFKNSSNILVLTGAGVSVSAGIPDFRSSTGIYARLHREFGMPRPSCMFDRSYFDANPKPFFNFAHELWPGNFDPTPCHHFISLLEQKQKLLRNYSQNIDTLEQKANIKRVINCHGSFATATCVSCGHRVEGKDIELDILRKRVARCPVCHGDEQKSEVGSSDAAMDGGVQGVAPLSSFGVLKPDIVFFGEALPNEFFSSLREDLRLVDLVVVIGTSLRVAPVSEILGEVDASVPAVLINREVVGAPNQFDVELLGDCDAIVGEICSMLGWDDGKVPASKSSLKTAEEVMQGQTGEYGERLVGRAVEEGYVVYQQPSTYFFKGFSMDVGGEGAEEEGSEFDPGSDSDDSFSYKENVTSKASPKSSTEPGSV